MENLPQVLQSASRGLTSFTGCYHGIFRERGDGRMNRALIKGLKKIMIQTYIVLATFGAKLKKLVFIDISKLN